MLLVFQLASEHVTAVAGRELAVFYRNYFEELLHLRLRVLLPEGEEGCLYAGECLCRDYTN